SSRRRHTSFSRDWSSDVCSSDLIFRRATPAVWSRDGKSLPPDIWFTGLPGFLTENRSPEILLPPPVHQSLHLGVGFQLIGITRRSEERRAGKQLRSARDIYP